MKFLTSSYTHESKQALTESSTDTHIHTVVHKHFSVHWKLGTHKFSVGQEKDARSAYYTREKEILRLWNRPGQQRRGAGSKLPALHSTPRIFWAAFHDLPFLQVSKCARWAPPCPQAPSRFDFMFAVSPLVTALLLINTCFWQEAGKTLSCKTPKWAPDLFEC